MDKGQGASWMMESQGANTPDLRSFDWIVVNSSAGKDSQTMLDVVAEKAREAGVLDRVVVVHCDLGRVEWEGTPELAREQTAHYGFRFEIVKRRQGDILEHVEKRGMWPSPAARYCTSDHKRGQVARLLTQLTKEVRDAYGLNCPRVRILNCLGFRAEESPARAKKKGRELELDKRATNSKREVWTWLPILDWTLDMVWARIKASGVPHHKAYDLGMPRLSCCFCIMAPRPALILAGIHNRELLDDYCTVEKKIEHDFKKGAPIREIRDAILDGEEPGEIRTWAA